LAVMATAVTLTRSVRHVQVVRLRRGQLPWAPAARRTADSSACSASSSTSCRTPTVIDAGDAAGLDRTQEKHEQKDECRFGN